MQDVEKNVQRYRLVLSKYGTLFNICLTLLKHHIFQAHDSVYYFVLDVCCIQPTEFKEVIRRFIEKSRTVK